MSRTVRKGLKTRRRATFRSDAVRQVESRLQQACVEWFRLQYPRYYHNFFAVPNGGRKQLKWVRTGYGGMRQICTEGARLKDEGVVAGVSDLLLLYPGRGFHGLCIEMKTTSKSSRQRDSQKEFQKAVEDAGYMYVVVRTFEEFQKVVTWYLAA